MPEPGSGRRLKDLSGPTRVTGSAGSGKTQQLVELAVEWLVGGNNPRRMVLVVRTRSAAERLRIRIEAELRAAHPQPQIVTHEGLARLVLELLGRSPGPDSTAGAIVEWLLMAEALRRSREQLPRLGSLVRQRSCVEDAIALVSASKRALVGPGLLAQRVLRGERVPVALRELPVIAAAYQRLLQESDYLDSQDRTRLALEAVVEEAEALSNWADLLLVDEAQDLDPAQWTLIRELGARLSPPRRLLMAGDWSEATPGFRSGTVEASSRPFEEYFPVELGPREWEQGDALPSWARRAAENLGVAPPGLSLEGERAALRVGPRARIWVAGDEAEEALAVARELLRVRADEGLEFRQCAVLGNGGGAQLVSVLLALDGLSIPYRTQLPGWPRRAATQVLLSWLRCLSRPEDDRAVLIALGQGPAAAPAAALRLLQRVASRLQVSLQRLLWGSPSLLEALSAEERRDDLLLARATLLGEEMERWRRAGLEHPPDPDRPLEGSVFLQLLGQVELGSGLAQAAASDLETARDLGDLARAAEIAVEVRRRLGTTELPLRSWLELLETAAGRGAGPQVGPARGARDEVEVLTLSQSKGGHWLRVFVVGCNAELIPAGDEGRGLLDPTEAEELTRLVPEMEDVLASAERRQDSEARLFLVALTRASGEVTCSWPRRREGKPAERSPFLGALLTAGVTQRPAPSAEPVSRDDLVVRLAVSGDLRPLGADGSELGWMARELRRQMEEWDPVGGAPLPLGERLGLSATSLAAWLACPRQYLGSRLVAEEEGQLWLLLGTEAHRLFEAAQLEQETWPGDPAKFREFGAHLIQERLLPQLRGQGLDRTSLVVARIWLEQAVARWAERIVAPGPDRTGTGIDAEIPFTVERPGWQLRGKVDSLWRHPDGAVEVVDYKTSATKGSDGSVRSAVFGRTPDGPVNWQLPIYFLAAQDGAFREQLGEEMPRRLRNWYPGLDPGSRPRDPIPAAGFTVVEGDQGRPGEITIGELERLSAALDRQAELIAGGRFPAQPRHAERTCRSGHGGCPLASWCDGEGSVGRPWPVPGVEL